MKRILPLLFLAGILIFFAPKHAHAQAGTAQFILEPSSASASPGNTLTIGILLNSGTELVNAVQANLTYPADKLQFESINTISSAFSIQAEGTGENGLVKIARGSITPVSGEAKVANVVFRVTQPITSQEITMGAESAIVSSVTNTNIYQGNFTVKSKNGGFVEQFQQRIAKQEIAPNTNQPGQIQVIPTSKRSIGNGGFFEKLVLFNVAIWEKIFSVIAVFTGK